MHVAIDDTYGPATSKPSKYITGSRRTYVAVEFPDDEVDYIRDNVANYVASIPGLFGISPIELHFVDVYNRNKVWKDASSDQNLAVFASFAKIYEMHRWRVHVQTVDDRTLRDHRIRADLTVDGIDLSKRDGQALFLLLTKIKSKLREPKGPLTLRADAGREKAGKPIGKALFREWGELYDGQYADSHTEPLIQIADFLAFSINRLTYLSLKPQRTEIDSWFLDLIGGMCIVSDDLKWAPLSPNFTIADIDAIHLADRKAKGLE